MMKMIKLIYRVLLGWVVREKDGYEFYGMIFKFSFYDFCVYICMCFFLVKNYYYFLGFFLCMDSFF